MTRNKNIGAQITQGAIKLQKILKEEKAKTEKMAEVFEEINNLIYAKGLNLGSDDYFKVRDLCCKFKPEK